MIEIKNCSGELQNILKNYLFKETDIGEFVEDMSLQFIHDFIIYGYNPWDYLEELKLNQKYQGFLK